MLKLADFGSVREIGVPLQTYTKGEKVASLWYKAPELLLGGQKYSTLVDIWSASCVFAELVIQQPFFDGATDFVQVIKVFSITGKPNEETWPRVTSIYDFLDSFASSEPQNLAEVVPSLEPTGLDLLCFKPEEIAAIMTDFAAPGSLAPTGLYLGGRNKVYGDPR
ncbi:hypothetical protein TEA_014798 [Camellia sinensis var. sinensis]|uniref:cyclin-dependent kinase n=1 Tax=Camellia sinensis var. sinensis TaxID=542762 RepID=A0A4S4ET43_CAMSN|nr:hypothetical protein TEA_014798 [Camellia sinensis var. sinensis]